VVVLAVVVGGAGAVGLKKPGTAALVVVMEGSGFGVGAGRVVEVGLTKKLGTAGNAGAGTVDEGASVGVANGFFVGSLVSVVVVVAAVAGFGCVEAAAAVGKPGIMELVVVAGAGAGVGTGDGFFSSATFFVS
jgi:hypothetical protein